MFFKFSLSFYFEWEGWTCWFLFTGSTHVSIFNQRDTPKIIPFLLLLLCNMCLCFWANTCHVAQGSVFKAVKTLESNRLPPNRSHQETLCLHSVDGTSPCWIKQCVMMAWTVSTPVRVKKAPHYLLQLVIGGPFSIAGVKESWPMNNDNNQNEPLQGHHGIGMWLLSTMFTVKKHSLMGTNLVVPCSVWSPWTVIPQHHHKMFPKNQSSQFYSYSNNSHVRTLNM